MKKLMIMILAFVPCGMFAQESQVAFSLNLESNVMDFASADEVLTYDRYQNRIKTFEDPEEVNFSTDNVFVESRNFLEDFNPYLSKGMVTYTKDGKTVYFSVNKKLKTKTKNNETEVKIKNAVNLQLFKANINEKGEWVDLEMLPFSSTQFSSGHPYLNEDDSKLYFVSDGPESMGRTDIFVVDLFEDGSYGKPENLGPEINSSEREIFPFIEKGNLLLFSSDVQNEKGNLDVFGCKIFDNTISKPVKLKGSIQIENDNFEGDFADLSNLSGDQKGNMVDDLYATIDASPANIECNQEIYGVVKNAETKELMPRVQMVLFDENNNKLESFSSDKNDASFRFEQSCNSSYTLKGYRDGYLVGEVDVQTVNDLGARPKEVLMTMVVDENDKLIVELLQADLEQQQKEAREAETSPANSIPMSRSSYDFNSEFKVYTVQIGAFNGNAETDKYIELSSLFNHVYPDGYNRYFSGVFQSYEEAANYKELLKKNGFEDSFVIGLKGENRF